jgi:hypothetical protein
MKARVVGTFAALGALTACGILDSNPKDVGTFSFELRETPIADTLSLWIELVVMTEPQSPCLTHALKGNAGFGIDVVAVTLERVALPRDVCIPSDGPAEFKYPIAFGPVRVDNPFYLTFESGGEVDRYLVIVSETAIDIAPLRSVFTHPINRRVPRG